MSGNFTRWLGPALRSFLNSILRELIKAGPRPGAGPEQRQRAGGKVTFPFQKPGRPAPAGLDPATTRAPTSHAAREYRMPATGLPRLEYAPAANGQADPGEVVWAWVPYEDDPAQGKDRPALVIAQVTGGFLALQMTSKDHSRDQAREAHFGRHWLDIGSGPWDSQGRDSQVRLDRLLFLPPDGVRREGATLPKDRYLDVAQALRALHG